MTNLGEMVSAAWEEVLRESPDPFDAGDIFVVGSRRTYRERLDCAQRNCYGEIISRIVIVRRNLRQLKRPVHPPRLPA